MKRSMWLAPLFASALALGGCSKAEDNSADETPTASPSGETLSATISDIDGISTFNREIRDANLSSVFDGASPYTILAPTDEALEALGPSADIFGADADPAPVIALMRNHIVTGHLRPQDLRAALEAAEDGTVRMSTVGSDPVTFAIDGNAIVARGADGTQVRLLVARASEASNGVVIPVDGVLRKLPANSED
ncbi:fasciclin domain-containing protein [Pseudoblastomonas halimionae]|uniref:FAS1 domain-containing protein n=1 Tax=Alteriqipengyuania halimionae TaxID=1926630 RepID=A0A6I4U2L0_9SPHN|nr:fasciclin domain-containing protein [Alteriqipengyuania halimionae]MXP10158.1 hypothetical protein [Alteriqipengyuania halimionae]